MRYILPARARRARRALTGVAVTIATLLTPLAPAHASGDLLVAPTRVVLEGRRSAEVVLNNVDDEPATYRISLELRRMGTDGRLHNVTPENATEAERAMLAMLSYSPRRVTLPPNQPQIIRIGVRAPEGLPDGEYRAHMLFRAIPDAAPVTGEAVAGANGVAIALTPIYGVTIPIIVRRGTLVGDATMSAPRLATDSAGQPVLQFDLAREGNRSVYGELIVIKDGVAEPVMVARGLAIYPEVGAREVRLPLTEEQLAALRGARVTLRYIEDRDLGGATIAELTGVQL
jgi:hypothetical protein